MQRKPDGTTPLKPLDILIFFLNFVDICHSKKISRSTPNFIVSARISSELWPCRHLHKAYLATKSDHSVCDSEKPRKERQIVVWDKRCQIVSIRQLVNIVLASHSINYKRFLTYFYMIQSPKRGNNCINPFWARQQGEHFFFFRMSFTTLYEDVGWSTKWRYRRWISVGFIY